MPVVVSHELRRTRKIEPLSQASQLPLRLRQRVLLLVVQQLQRMLDLAEEEIPAGEMAVFVGLNEVVVHQPYQAIERVDAVDAGMLEAVDQLQVLGGELDVANTAATALDLGLQQSLRSQLVLDLLLHRQDALPGQFGIDLKDLRLQPLQHSHPDIDVPGNRAGLQQSLLLPQPAVLADVIEVRLPRRHQRPGLPPRPETHVDPVQEPRRRHFRQTANQPLGERRVGSAVSFTDEHQVDVRAVVQLFAPQLTHRQHAEVGSLASPFLTGMPQGQLHNPIGE